MRACETAAEKLLVGDFNDHDREPTAGTRSSTPRAGS
jgi:hypothetical protein